MKQTRISVVKPTANICINKNRLKEYNKTELPTVYLERGTSFEIELYNPLSENVLAKISLNGKLISQAGLIIRPAERVYLDRFIDVARKFLFDTYEVSGSDEVKKIIKDNGDVKIDFFMEYQLISYFPVYNCSYNVRTPWDNTFFTSSASNSKDIVGTTTTSTSHYNNSDLSSINLMFNNSIPSNILRGSSLEAKKEFNSGNKNKKSIETGRVEQGATSKQEFQNVDKTFNTYPFHTVEYKLLPVSQMLVQSEDLSVRRYCANCGSKTRKGDKFCSSCGKKL
jgi:hypothetical protein